MSSYSIYHGDFKCHVCKVQVRTLRHYVDKKELTWMCEAKHLSTVNLNTKKTKKDYERKIGK
jgi:hypothetical protein